MFRNRLWYLLLSVCICHTLYDVKKRECHFPQPEQVGVVLPVSTTDNMQTKERANEAAKLCYPSLERKGIEACRRSAS